MHNKNHILIINITFAKKLTQFYAHCVGDTVSLLIASTRRSLLLVVVDLGIGRRENTFRMERDAKLQCPAGCWQAEGNRSGDAVAAALAGALPKRGRLVQPAVHTVRGIH